MSGDVLTILVTGNLILILILIDIRIQVIHIQFVSYTRMYTLYKNNSDLSMLNHLTVTSIPWTVGGREVTVWIFRSGHAAAPDISSLYRLCRLLQYCRRAQNVNGHVGK